MLHLFFRFVFITMSNLTLSIGTASLTLPYPECPTSVEQSFYSRCTNYVGVTTAYRDISGNVHFTWTYPHPGMAPDVGTVAGLPAPTCRNCILDPDGSRFAIDATPAIIGYWTVVNGTWTSGELGSQLTNR